MLKIASSMDVSFCNLPELTSFSDEDMISNFRIEKYDKKTVS
jgi:hypothetical protein